MSRVQQIGCEVPFLHGRRLRLRPPVPEDLSQLHSWFCDPQLLHLWSNRRELLPLEHFADDLYYKIRSGDLFLLLVERNPGPASSNAVEALGFCYLYDRSLPDGVAFLCTFLDPRRAWLGAGAEAAFLFLDYIFNFFSLRKICVDIYEYNSRSLQTSKKAGFVVEGRFRSHRFFAGRYWDVFRLSLTRRRWEQQRERFAHRFYAPGNGARKSPVVSCKGW